MKMHAAQLTFDGSEEIPEQASDGIVQFMKVSAREEGLLLPAQAAIVLDVSNQRVLELVQLGKLQRWEFFGKGYLSAREIVRRRNSDLKGGRPPRKLVQRIKTAGKLIGKMDAPQWAAAAVGAE